MINLSSLTNSQLDDSSVLAAKSERSALLVILEHLAEVNRRKSFSPRYESINKYAMLHLGYDDKSAWSRVNAMFLMVQVPEIKPSIQSGELDLTKLSMVQSHIRVENAFEKSSGKSKMKMNKAEKLKVVNMVKGKASREAMRTLMKQSSAPQKLKIPDQVKPLADELNEVRITLSDEDLRNLKELRELMGHRDLSLSEVVSLALKEAKESILKKKSRRAADEPRRSETRVPGAALKRHVYSKADGACEICGSKSATEFDHIKPWALGGETSGENLRLLCRNCNQRESIQMFGSYLKEPVVVYSA